MALRIRLLAHLLLYFASLEKAVLAISILRPKSLHHWKQIVVHRIKSPCIKTGRFMRDDELKINDPILFYFERDPWSFVEEDGSYCYIATYDGESVVVGMAEVVKGWELDEDYNALPYLRGIFIRNVHMVAKYRRKGVMTAIFNAIENDGNELMEEYSRTQSYFSTFDTPDDGTIEISLFTVSETKVLLFFKLLGFKPEPWNELWDDLKPGADVLPPNPLLRLVKKLDENNPHDMID